MIVGTWLRNLLISGALTIAAIAVITALGSLLLVMGQSDPAMVVPVMVKGIFGTRAAFAETLLRFTPLVIVALGLAPSLRVGLFNIGAPGQIAMGGLCSTFVALYLPLPASIAIPLCAVAAAAGGALSAWIPGVLRARLKVNEILSTLVFNFLILLFLQYLLTGPMQGVRANLPQSDPFPEATWLPTLIPGTRANLGFLLIPIVFAAALIFNAGPVGYRLRLLGASSSLAIQGGISERRMIVGTMCLAGAAAGIAGWLQAAGIDHRLYASIATPIGYTGLFAALVGRLNPIGILASSFLFAALLRGGDSLQIGADVSPEIISALIGIIMLVMAVRSAGIRKTSTR
jgi:general nucleoside transport system permease protein